MFELIRNYKDNVRCTYEEPEINIYNESYYKEQCGGFKEFNRSNGEELDSSRHAVLNLCPLESSYSALDVGCGRGELVLALARQGLEYVAGIDLSEDSIKLAREVCEKQIISQQVTIQRMSATSLEFNDNLFNVIYMTDVVEHLCDSNLKIAISEAYRALKPGGKLIIHTLPTVNYKLYGQYLTKYYLALQGRKWWTPTTREEAGIGHVNIQSKKSLESYLHKSFKSKNTNVFYAPVNPEGILKKLISCLNIWNIMSPHLWAVAIK